MLTKTRVFAKVMLKNLHKSKFSKDEHVIESTKGASKSCTQLKIKMICEKKRQDRK